MKKILFIFILLLLCILNVNASTDSVYSGDWIPNIYIKKVNSKIISYRMGRFIRKSSDNSIVYCVEPFETMKEKSNYSTYTDDYAKRLGISESVWNKISLISYYGYGYSGHTDDKWYPITQIMIWREIDKNSEFYFTDTLNGNKIDKYDKEIEEIKKLVNNHNKLPSFANKTYDFSINSENILTDSNNILNGFSIESYNNKLKVKKDLDKLYIYTEDEISSSIIFKKEFKKYNKASVAFIDSNYQNLVSPGDLNPLKFRLDIQVNAGIVKINKLDFDTSKKQPQGEGILIGSKYNIYNSNNEIVDTLIIGNDYSATSKKLEYGIYKIKEVESMNGYYLDQEVYEININNNNLNYELNLKNKIIKSKIIIYKYYDENLEEGVEFEIYNSLGELIDTVITDENGKIEKELPFGTYIFHQLNSKKNYKCVEDFKVVVDSKSDKVQILNLYDEKFSAKIKVIKKDSKTGEVIDDSVTFKIFDILKNEYVKIKENDLFETTNGVLVIDKLDAGEYFLEEVKSPTGYTLPSEKFYFNVDDENIFSYDEYNNPILEINVMNDKEKIIIEVPNTSQDYEYKLLFLVDERKRKLYNLKR